jgi:hypothetical protein
MMTMACRRNRPACTGCGGRGQEPRSASDLLAWRDHVEKARKLCIDACRAWRAYDSGARFTGAIRGLVGVTDVRPFTKVLPCSPNPRC